MSSVCMCVVVYRQVCNTHMNTHIRIQRGMTVYVNASYSCTGIHRRAWQQTREATCESNKRHVCCDVRGSKKSSLHMYIVQYAILTYIHTERPYMGTFSAICEHLHTGMTSHQYTTACSRRQVNHLAINCLESSPCKTQDTQRYGDICRY
jgi:hypothetical protein